MPDDPTLSLPWPQARPLDDGFFQRDAQCVARELLGKVIRHRVNGLWLAARRLHAGKFNWASSPQPSLPISTTQLGALVLGLPWQRVGHTGAITLV